MTPDATAMVKMTKANSPPCEIETARLSAARLSWPEARPRP
jgi:hypothetical protein